MVVLLLGRPMNMGRYLTAQPSPQLLDARGELLCAMLNEREQWSFPVGFQEISPLVVQATIATEDQRFWSHPGVDAVAVLRAVVQNVRGGEVASGASTLTMQLVKLSGQRTASRWRTKLVEAWQALRLERKSTKQQLLEAYLNKAPYGANLVGVEAASRRYFGKRNRELTLSEAALLAGLPKAPSYFQPVEHPERALERRNHVLSRMLAEGMIDEAAYQRALRQPVSAAWHALPMLAPHLARQLHAPLKQEKWVQVTLQARLQRRLEALVPKYLKRFDNEIANAAVIVVDAPSATVLARVGNSDFLGAPGGQMDLCGALRSPGSALKPFTYALAMERNVLYPTEMLLDDTLDLGTYNPGNFDGDYHGLVSAKQALAYSLNVPAVMALERVGVGPLRDFLRTLGFSALTQSASYYGLGLTLGDCEVTLEQLTAAYCMLANEGVWQPLRLLHPDAGAEEDYRVISRGTVLALFDMLEAPFPHEFEQGFIEARGVRPRVCWKTGTSTGYHDAWAIAFNKQYVVAVWVGNSDGRASRRIIGAQAALPLAGRIFRELGHTPGEVWPAIGDDFRETAVCVASGLPVSPWCPAQRAARLPARQYLNRRCDVHRLPGVGKTVLARWPGSPLRWDLARIGLPHPVDVPETSGEAVALQITAPADQAEYILTGEEAGDQVMLGASTQQSSTLYWYLDGQFLGQSSPGKPVLLALETGAHELSCMGPSGETDCVRFNVRAPAATVELKTY
ncbi:MAG: penicillin-binding protein 1C [Candidatus Hydrogenedentes bacterium]|nr:penicillin-binding protein 1C [Candidatus Hydrogenedentota bacterium]